MTELAVLCPIEDTARSRSLAALSNIAEQTARMLDGHVVSIELVRKQLPQESSPLCLRVVVQTTCGRFDY